MNKKHRKIKRYTFGDKVRDLRYLTINYGINLIFALVLFIPFLLYFGFVNLCGIDIMLILVTLLVMICFELLHAIVNHKEYIEIERQLTEISKANKQYLKQQGYCCCKHNQRLIDTIASKS